MAAELVSGESYLQLRPDRVATTRLRIEDGPPPHLRISSSPHLPNKFPRIRATAGCSPGINSNPVNFS